MTPGHEGVPQYHGAVVEGGAAEVHLLLARSLKRRSETPQLRPCSAAAGIVGSRTNEHSGGGRSTAYMLATDVMQQDICKRWYVNEQLILLLTTQLPTGGKVQSS
jgi:hypothetical protein